LLLTGAAAVRVLGVRFAGCTGSGIFANTGNSFIVNACDFYNNAENNITLQAVIGCHISSSRFVGGGNFEAGNYGKMSSIFLRDNSENIIINGCYFEYLGDAATASPLYILQIEGYDTNHQGEIIFTSNATDNACRYYPFFTSDAAVESPMWFDRVVFDGGNPGDSASDMFADGINLMARLHDMNHFGQVVIPPGKRYLIKDCNTEELELVAHGSNTEIDVNGHEFIAGRLHFITVSSGSLSLTFGRVGNTYQVDGASSHDLDALLKAPGGTIIYDVFAGVGSPMGYKFYPSGGWIDLPDL
jgi:hypothetical protein